ncbi:hypothetical protein LVB77_06360 [Lysobacter sp. 5GHs7-4]|uniref:hypothetical protein n=1 Tax=Lysobacter sp. 5GHs7-4 TaxID=2904253 RepID=UPI001E477756|nr:hypothetical protein [Lysobacter sp. 5GHs7-4]UHQ24314.1 hypothetical protein LVB77_06360 [Lysobacter sp. 5GHs7-4]
MADAREIVLTPFGQRLSLADVRRIAYPVAQHIGARIVEMIGPGVTPNFHGVMLDEPLRWGETQRVYLLHSDDYDAWAVVAPADPRCEPEDGWFHLHYPRFLDHEGIAAAMADFHGIALWSSYELSMAVPPDFPQRAPNDLAHWQPPRLGDALFNWWD